MSRRLGPFELSGRVSEEGLDHSAALAGSALNGTVRVATTAHVATTANVSRAPSSLSTSSPSKTSRANERASAKVVYLFGKPSCLNELPRQPVVEKAGPALEFETPERNYDCGNYSTCLGLAAALDWSSFSCKGCSGCVNEKLVWRAHQKIRENKALQRVCNLPVLR